MKTKTDLQESSRLEKMERVIQAENSEEVKFFKKTNLVISEGLTIEEVEKEVHAQTAKKVENHIESSRPVTSC